jgi:hypothetical protein
MLKGTLIYEKIFKTCKARFSLRENSFTEHDFRRTCKVLEKKSGKLNKKQRKAPHHHYCRRNNLRRQAPARERH